jgi:hypothetical protein
MSAATFQTRLSRTSVSGCDHEVTRPAAVGKTIMSILKCEGIRLHRLKTPIMPCESNEL